MTKPPRKTKPRDDWTMAEVIEHVQTGEEPVSDAWREYVADAAEAAGLAVEDLGLPPVPVTERPIEDLGIEDLIERQRNRY